MKRMGYRIVECRFSTMHDDGTPWVEKDLGAFHEWIYDPSSQDPLKAIIELEDGSVMVFDRDEFLFKVA